MIGLNLILLIGLIFFTAGLTYLSVYLFSSRFRDWLLNANKTRTEKLVGKRISKIIYYQPRRYRLFSIISISIVFLLTAYLSIQLYLGFNLREARYYFNTRQYEDSLIYYHKALIVKEKNVKKYPFLNYFYQIILFYDDKVYSYQFNGQIFH